MPNVCAFKKKKKKYWVEYWFIYVCLFVLFFYSCALLELQTVTFFLCFLCIKKNIPLRLLFVERINIWQSLQSSDITQFTVRTARRRHLKKTSNVQRQIHVATYYFGECMCAISMLAHQKKNTVKVLLLTVEQYVDTRALLYETGNN